jgi:outer membrane protein assembly factor BamA
LLLFLRLQRLTCVSAALLQLRPGHIFNIGAGKQALKNINSLALFSNIEVNPRPDETKEGGIVVEIKLKELEPKSAEVSTEWSIVPGRQGRPTLVSCLINLQSSIFHEISI